MIRPRLPLPEFKSVVDAENGAAGPASGLMPPTDKWVRSSYGRTVRVLMVGRGARRAAVAGIGLHTLPFIVVFTVWYAGNLGEIALPSLTWAMPIAATWIVLGPLLMFVGEIGFGRTYGELIRTSGDNWPFGEIEKWLERCDRWRIPVCALVVAVTGGAYWFGSAWLDRNILIGEKWSATWWTGAAVVCQIGWSAGHGIWGVLKSVGFVHAATSVDRNVHEPALPPWAPFRPEQAPGMESLAFFSLSTALVFSCGSVLAPAIITVALSDSISSTSSALMLAFVVVLTLGSSILFLVPTTRLRALAHLQRVVRLDTLALEIEELATRIRAEESPDTTAMEKCQLLLNLRNAIAAESPHPRNLAIVGRLPMTTFLPVLSVAGTWLGLALK